jgi:hypothetical protein
MEQRTITAGVFPDVTSGNGYTWLIAREGNPGAPGAIVIWLWEADQLAQLREVTRIPIGGGTPSFPRIYLDPWGVLWFAYSDGASTGYLTNASSGAVSALTPCENNDPICFGSGCVAWQGAQAAGWPITRRDLRTGETAAAGRGAGTGLSRILEDGTVRLVDDDRTIVPGGTRPCWAADLVVVESHGDHGALGRLDDGRERLLWPDVQIITPRCSYEPHWAVYAVAGWSSNDGQIRAAVLRAEDFNIVTPPIEPPITPPIEPPKPPIVEPPTMRLPDDVFNTLKQQRARFGPTPNDAELGIILNDTAWVHRSVGWGVNTKNSGTNCPQPGQPPGMIAHDILHHQPTNMIFDCLIAAGGSATPTQADGSVMTISDRPWRAPNAPTSGGTIPPTPPTSDLEQRLAIAENQIAALTAQVRALEAQAAQPIGLLSHHGKFLVAEKDGTVKADRAGMGPWETWTVTR